MNGRLCGVQYRASRLLITVRKEVAKVMFLPVCLSTGGSASVHAGMPPPGPDPPGPGTPHMTRHPQDQPPPPPWANHLPRDQATPLPQEQTATAADGTHPTGMHSCFEMKSVAYLFEMKNEADFSVSKFNTYFTKVDCK